MIQIENLTYSYDQKTVLKNLNLTIPDGMKIGIIGESGSGKTTLIKLISGLYEVQQGKIYTEGKMSVVMQGNKLFPFTIRETSPAVMKFQKIRFGMRLELHNLKNG